MEMKMYYIYNEKREVIAKTPIKEQATSICLNKAERDGKVYGRTNDFGCKSWYGKGGFVCNMQ